MTGLNGWGQWEVTTKLSTYRRPLYALSRNHSCTPLQSHLGTQRERRRSSPASASYGPRRPRFWPYAPLWNHCVSLLTSTLPAPRRQRPVKLFKWRVTSRIVVSSVGRHYSFLFTWRVPGGRAARGSTEARPDTPRRSRTSGIHWPFGARRRPLFIF